LETELADATPSVRRADFIALLKRRRSGKSQPYRAVIVEVQRERDDEKPPAWLEYIAYLHRKHRVPVTLIVLVFDPAVARWAKRSRSIGSNVVFRPLVIGPEDLPEITSTDDALAHPSLAVLTALAHLGARRPKASRRDEIVRVFEAILRAEETRFRRAYLSLLHGVAKNEFRTILEGLMEAYGMGALDMIRAEGEADGLLKGKAVASAAAVLKVLRARGIAVDDAHQQRILATRDLDALDRWLLRALNASHIDEVLD
jgi:hypothetical protein